MAISLLDRQTVAEGEKIFTEGDSGERAYIVENGEVEVYSLKNDKKMVYGIVGKGGIFGEMALVDDKPRMATAQALKGTTVIVISRAMFEEKLSRTDPFIRGLLKIFASNIRSMSSKNKPVPIPAEISTDAAKPTAP
jgi:CRP/FNR family cyclic AMP-dependent transcriptional regulator